MREFQKLSVRHFVADSSELPDWLVSAFEPLAESHSPMRNLCAIGLMGRFGTSHAKREASQWARRYQGFAGFGTAEVQGVNAAMMMHQALLQGEPLSLEMAHTRDNLESLFWAIEQSSQEYPRQGWPGYGLLVAFRALDTLVHVRWHDYEPIRSLFRADPRCIAVHQANADLWWGKLSEKNSKPY
jgi:hypothetical protein